MSTWTIACSNRALRREPLAVQVGPLPLVLYRDRHGTPHALLDRCPHRAAPLSLGWVKGDRLVCAYHGWEFDAQGTCCHIPSDVEPTRPRACLQTFELAEAGPYLWVRTEEGPERPAMLVDDLRGVRTWSQRLRESPDTVRAAILAEWLGNVPAERRNERLGPHRGRLVWDLGEILWDSSALARLQGDGRALLVHAVPEGYGDVRLEWLEGDRGRRRFRLPSRRRFLWEPGSGSTRHADEAAELLEG